VAIQKVLVDNKVGKTKLMEHHQRIVILVIFHLLLVAWFSWLFLHWDRINLLFFLLFSLWDILLVRILDWLTSHIIGLLFLGILLRLHNFFHVYIAPNFWAKVLTIISHNMQVRNEISDGVFRHCKLSHHLAVAT